MVTMCTRKPGGRSGSNYAESITWIVLITLAMATWPASTHAQNAPPPPSEPWQAPDFKPSRDLPGLAEIDAIPRHTMPLLDYDAIEEEDHKREFDGLPPRYAIPHPVKINIAAAGLWEDLGNGLTLLRYRVSCSNAQSINFGFSRYNMPAGGRMFVYAADNSTKMRPFTWLDNETHGELWTPPVESHDVIIEVTLPRRRVRDLKLELGSINIGYLKFGDMISRSGSCNVDVICPEGDSWRGEIASVAVISTGGSTFCTGAMINNVRQDREPFFLTANHCGINAGNAPSLVTFWNYENSTCRPPGSGASGGNGDGDLSQFNTGATWLASLSASDFTLVLLDDMPDPAFDVHYAGWDSRDFNADAAVCIHHPDTDEKRISFEDDPTTTTSYSGTSTPGDGTHVRITDWDLGTTEPGSSGSPLFDAATHRVIGQLHGGGAACGNDLSDWFGKFGYSWTGAGTNTTRLSNWLDPDDTGTQFVDTIGNGIAVSPTQQVTHLGSIGGPFTNSPTVYTLTNNQSASANYEVSLGAGDAPLTLDGGAGPVSGALAGSGGSTTVDVAVAGAANVLPAGTYTREVVFEDTTNAISTTTTHVLEIGQVGFAVSPASGFSTGGPTGGPFTGSMNFTVTSTQPNPIDVEVSTNVGWLSVGSASRGSSHIVSLNGQDDSDEVMVWVNGGAESLGEGEHTATLLFTDLTGDGADDTTRPVLLDVGRFTYAATGLPAAIPDAGGGSLQNTINVGDSYCVADVNVSVAIDHSYIGDLRVELSHDGTTVAIIDRPGFTGSGFGCGEANFNVTLDDEGIGGAIEDQCQSDLASPPSYTPNEPLADLASVDVGGNWTLTVTDNAGQDTGSLIAWSLKISPDSSCVPIADPILVDVPTDTPTPIQLTGTSPLGNELTYIITSLPGSGTLSELTRGGGINSVPHVLASDTVVYSPDPGADGGDAFMYQVNDGVPSEDAQVTLSIGGPGVIYQWLLDTDPGWETDGDWAFGVPQGVDNDPSSGFTGPNVYGYNLAGEYPNDLDEQYLTTTAIDCSALADVTLCFYRQLGVESNTWDHASVQVSTNGITWSTIWANGPITLIETAWSVQNIDISAYADGQSTVYVRWVMGETDGSYTYAGWNIDDIRIKGIMVDVPQPGDFDDDDDVDLDDLLAVIAGWGVYDLDDLLDVIAHWGEGT